MKSKSEEISEAMRDIAGRLSEFFKTELLISKELEDLPTFPVMLSIIAAFTSSIFITLLKDGNDELPDDWRVTYKKLSNQFRDQLLESVKPREH